MAEPQGNGYEEILATFNPADIAMIKSLLDSEAIDYYFKGEFFNFVEPLIQPARLMVRQDQMDVAKEILSDLRIAYWISDRTDG